MGMHDRDWYKEKYQKNAHNKHSGHAWSQAERNQWQSKLDAASSKGRYNKLGKNIALIALFVILSISGAVAIKALVGKDGFSLQTISETLLNKTGTGAGGFDFTKIANNGDELDATATLGSAANQWACTRDNVTGLIWEVKVNDANHLRHQNHTYTWYNTNSPDGNKGTASGGSCKTSGRCDTEKFVADVNNASLCGASDWRMPTIKELESIVHYGRVAPAIDTRFFPNTPSWYFWSGSPFAFSASGAWLVYFVSGDSYANLRSYNDIHVRLVRGGQ